jgi:hypothetical protein
MIKFYPYVDVDGNHWPDTAQGSSEYYAIDLYQYLTTEEDTITGVTWTIPPGLDAEDSFEDASTAYVKITATKRGSHKIVFTLNSIESGKAQTTVLPIILKVY